MCWVSTSLFLIQFLWWEGNGERINEQLLTVHELNLQYTVKPVLFAGISANRATKFPWSQAPLIPMIWVQIPFYLFIYLFSWTGVWTQGFIVTNQVLYCLSHTFSSFCSVYFGDGISQSICPCWPQTVILLILASQVARITGLSYQCLDQIQILPAYLLCDLGQILGKFVLHFPHWLCLFTDVHLHSCTVTSFYYEKVVCASKKDQVVILCTI
jgi:hypothetical protein